MQGYIYIQRQPELHKRELDEHAHNQHVLTYRATIRCVSIIVVSDDRVSIRAPSRLLNLRL